MSEKPAEPTSEYRANRGAAGAGGVGVQGIRTRGGGGGAVRAKCDPHTTTPSDSTLALYCTPQRACACCPISPPPCKPIGCIGRCIGRCRDPTSHPTAFRYRATLSLDSVFGECRPPRTHMEKMPRRRCSGCAKLPGSCWTCAPSDSNRRPTGLPQPTHHPRQSTLASPYIDAMPRQDSSPKRHAGGGCGLLEMHAHNSAGKQTPASAAVPKAVP